MEILLLGTAVGGVLAFDKFFNKKTKEKFQPPENPIKFKYDTLAKSGKDNYTANKILYKQKVELSEPYQGDNMLDMKNRTMSDFKNNWFVPNKLKFTQNMTGTGINESSYLGFDHRTNCCFGNDGESSSLPILDRYTGIDKTYMHHKESGPLFSPQEQQDRWIGQAPLTRPDLDRFKQDFRFKPDEKPCEPIRVGPGLGLGANETAEGGFNAGLNSRILPTNIVNYESNILQGGTVPGKHYCMEMPTSLPGNVSVNKNEKYGVPQYKPETFWTQEQRPMVPTGAQHLQSAVTYSAQSGPLKTGIARKIATQHGFGEIRVK